MGHSSKARRVRLALACVPAGLLVSGCAGARSGEEQVRATLQRFAGAVAQRDYHELCTQLLASNLTEKLAQIGLPCERAMARGLGHADDPKLQMRGVRVQGTTASALVYTTASNQPSSEDTIRLVKVNGGWRITSLGSET
jgi:hypothetical protein